MKQSKILLVDDEENIRFLFKEELEEEGYLIETASNGLEAIEKAREPKIDLIVMDIKMPGMNGIQALNEIKKIRKDLPVILCSAYGEFQQDLTSWVSDAYVVKSADMGELKRTIKELLNVD